jgi:hypothetical protein
MKKENEKGATVSFSLPLGTNMPYDTSLGSLYP